ncbi:hypothetical protein MAR_010094 [Mya arenaria]|uniref:Chitin-binding type-4 domain-containing protein n=1 Tax=Mya arenaria TaxID=6604 RepID=A0ABY7E8Q5_MYAAR|nr:hypothetical protein MAR_010094 [Mya arenaria]
MEITSSIPLVGSVLFVTMVTVVSGHGRLLEPPSRSSLWRFGYKTPINYDDNQLFCGGFDVQWHQNGGRCGVCGDPYKGRRENEAGGKYATGTIARRYTEGQTFSVTVEVTTNHGGYFEFRICPNNDPTRPVTESCLDEHLLQQPSGDTRWLVPDGTRMFSLSLVLPRGLTCSQCVLQWKWNTGCADVAIRAANVEGYASNSQAPMGKVQIGPIIPLNGGTIGSGLQTPNIGSEGSSSAGSSLGSLLIGGAAAQPQLSANFQAIDGGRGFVGTVTAVCKATPLWRSRYILADQWCNTQCAAGACPPIYCQDGCKVLYAN